MLANGCRERTEKGKDEEHEDKEKEERHKRTDGRQQSDDEPVHRAPRRHQLEHT